MKICFYVENEDRIKGGIRSSIQNQRKALDLAGVDYTEDPSDDYDIFHTNLITPKAYYHARKARKQGIPVIAHTHVTGEDFRNSMRFSNLVAPLVGRYASFFYRRADRLIAPSDYTKGLLQQKDLNTPISVVSNGIDPERFDGQEDITGMKEEYGTEEPTVINLGLIFERKGLSDYVQVARELPDIDFRWFGPELNGLLTARTTKKQMQQAPDNLRFPGFVDDIRKAMALGDIFFWPTHEENQGMSLIEAAYCGIAPVIRDIPTYDGWFEHEVNCLKGDSTDDFIRCIERLRDDPDLRERIGENAKELADEHTLDNIGEKLAETYLQTLENS